MFKKKKVTATPEAPTEFTLERNDDLVNENGERDYFTEYYRKYKNDYITQYLEAYKKFKNIDVAIDSVHGINTPPSPIEQEDSKK